MVRLGLAVPAWILAVLFDIAGTLFKGEVYVPLLLEDEDGTAHGNDWARGFMRGMGMRHDGSSAREHIVDLLHDPLRPLHRSGDQRFGPRLGLRRSSWPRRSWQRESWPSTTLVQRFLRRWRRFPA
ncbi:MAG: hypothetical protein ABSG23_14710 [Terriglobales bacterium]|jgi:hypothetical protein